MQKEMEAFQAAMTGVGSAVSTLKNTAAALHAAIDQTVDKIGKQVASDTAAPVQQPAPTTTVAE